MSANKVYVGNLSWNTTDDVLHSAFSAYGQVTDCIVMKDRETGRSRGFGFVTFANQTEAEGAIAAMNEQDLDGRRVRVNMANQKPATGFGYQSGYGGAAQGGYNNQGGGGYGQQQGGQQYGSNNYGGGGGGYGGQQNNYGAGAAGPQGSYGGGGGYPTQQGYQGGGDGGYGAPSGYGNAGGYGGGHY